jgi:hypothetical protein
MKKTFFTWKTSSYYSIHLYIIPLAISMSSGSGESGWVEAFSSCSVWASGFGDSGDSMLLGVIVVLGETHTLFSRSGFESRPFRKKILSF